MTNEPLSRRETDQRAVELERLVRSARRVVRRQILILSALLILGTTLFLWAQGRSDERNLRSELKFQQQITGQCVLVRDGNTNFNKALDVLLTNAYASQSLTPLEKAQRAAQYLPLHLPIGTCPPVKP